MNLQLFADDKKHPATPRHRQRARQKGQVFRSSEVNAAVVLLAGIGVIVLLGNTLLSQIVSLFHQALGQWTLMTSSWATDTAIAIGTTAGRTWFLTTVPLLAALALTALLANALQVGLVWTLEPVNPNLNRINPIEGAKRIFSRRSLFELGKGIFKVLLVVVVSYGVLRQAVNAVITRSDGDVAAIISIVGDYGLSLVWRAVGVLAVVALLDYLYQRFEYERNLMMTHQQVKDELKETEGDPHLRARIRKRQRELAQMRMLQDVAEADVVITNPTHYAVALKYDPEKMSAPVCCAKGKDWLALRIREIARQHNVTWVEDRYLARTLYGSVELGQPVPPALYKAVAEVLAFVWRLKGRSL